MPNLIDPRDPLILILSTNLFGGAAVDLVVVVLVVVALVVCVVLLENGECHGFSVDVKIRDSSVRSTLFEGLAFDGRGDVYE